MLGNLLDNACKYSAAEVRATLGYATPETVQVAVADTGIGIAPADQARIFDEFFQVDGTHRAVGEGYGLGLTVARRMAVLMGGALSVASELGKGSTFTLTLPASIVSGTPESVITTEDVGHSTARLAPDRPPTGATAAP